MADPFATDSTETLDSFSFFQDENQEREEHSFDDGEIQLGTVNMPVSVSGSASIDSDTDCACE